jgi:hypothetical protein
MKRVAGGVVLAASLLVAVPTARANDVGGTEPEDGKSEAERRLDEVQAELDAQRLQILDLKAQLNPPQEGSAGGTGDAVKQYLESEDGKKALDKSLFDMGFAKTGLGTLKFGGLFDFWYVHQRDGESSSGARTGADTFRIRRAEIALSGNILKDTVDFNVMFDPARQVGNNETTPLTKSIMQDLKLMYKGVFGAPKDVVATVGQFKIPFGREGFSQSTSKLDFINRSDGATAFSDARRPGAMVQGAPVSGAIEWFANVHNNNGQNSSDTARDQKNLVGRLVVNPLKFGSAEEAKSRGDKMGLLSMGGTYQKGYEPTGRTDFKRYGADLEWRKGKVLSDKDGVFFTTEWFRADHDDTLAVDKRSHNFAAGYKVNDNWEGVARHDLFKDQAGTTERVTDTFGVNYFIKGHNAKINLDYIRVRQQNAAAGRTLVAQIILQFQIAF